LVACRAPPCGRAVDRPAHYRPAHPAPLAGPDSRHRLSEHYKLFPSARSRPISSTPSSPPRTRAFTSITALIWHAIPTRGPGRHGRWQARVEVPPSPSSSSKTSSSETKPLVPPQGRRDHAGSRAELVPASSAFSSLCHVVEWGPGIFMALSRPAALRQDLGPHISRERAARIAAILPAPLTPAPRPMNHYSAVI